MGNPDREAELIDQYRQIHSNKTYGRSSEILIGVVQRHIYDLPPVKTILDFGCGRSRLVDWLAKIHDATPYRYDPAIPEFATMPVKQVDLVLCTDVMEHIPAENVAEVIATIRAISPNAYFNISCRRADEILPNGENAHCTVRPPRWWARNLREVFPDTRRTRSFGKDDVSLITWDNAA